jgi:hypothetical protein
MIDRLYVKWPATRPSRGSWHVFVTFTRAGRVLLRCGKSFAGQSDMRQSHILPLDAKSCERCAVLTLHDETGVTNDPVPEPVPDDEVIEL